MPDSLNRREVLKSAIAAGMSIGLLSGQTEAAAQESKPIRLGLIGVGGRGTYFLQMLLNEPDIEITAVCDINKEHLDRALGLVEAARGERPAGYSEDELDYRNLLGRDDVDAVLIATSIKWHGIMSIDAMKAGKHVGSEVPACETLEECRGLVQAKEEHGVRYMMLENYLFTEPNLAVLNMVRQGLFGETYFAECGYIHEYKHGQYNADGSLNWRGELMTSTYGNHYPTHSGGPVFKWLGINDGDRLLRVSCYAAEPNRTAPQYYAKRFGQERADQLTWRLGEMTTCVIRTELGKVIKMDLDVQSNRPHAIGYYLLQGTGGIYDNRFGVSLVNPELPADAAPEFHWEQAESLLEKYRHPLWQQEKEKATATGHGGGDYFTLGEFLAMLRENREPWVDVYDAASWSAIYECSRKSLDQNNAAIDIPDFTNGRWREAHWRPHTVII